MKFALFVLATVVIVSVAYLHPGQQDFPAMPIPATVLSIDVTAFFTPQQRAAWRPVAKSIAAASKPGTELHVLAISDHTLDSGSFFHRLMPVEPDRGNASIEDLIGGKTELIKFRQDSERALDSLFAIPGNSAMTDVFSVFDRLPKSTTELILMTDALNSTTDCDLEHMALKRDAYNGIIQALASKHRWSNATLRGVSVKFVLPSVEAGNKTKFVNDRRTLREFYDLLIRTIGGSLDSWGTQLN